jgi:hypothetical protein
MQRLRAITPSRPLFSMGTPSVGIQIVATSTGLVLDIQAENTATAGHMHKCHAVAKLPLDFAMQFGSALQSAIDVAWGVDDGLTVRSDPRQTAVWSNATFTEPAGRRAA